MGKVQTAHDGSCILWNLPACEVKTCRRVLHLNSSLALRRTIFPRLRRKVGKGDFIGAFAWWPANEVGSAADCKQVGNMDNVLRRLRGPGHVVSSWLLLLFARALVHLHKSVD